jgi:hypothetical protein
VRLLLLLLLLLLLVLLGLGFSLASGVFFSAGTGTPKKKHQKPKATRKKNPATPEKNQRAGVRRPEDSISILHYR